MKYAPVIIPTLCRYSHFKNCIDSLSCNTGAEYTDLYIGLDYPLNESHREGYNKINDYLDSIKGFKSVTVIRQDANIGAPKNIDLLKELVLSKYDRFIFSEDDNIFSPNFLEFINKGLELYENDQSVLAICGYRHFYNIRFDDNTYFKQNADFSAWGYGIWKNRLEEMHAAAKNCFFVKKSMNPLLLAGVAYRGLNQLLILLSILKKSLSNRIRFSDTVLSIYMYYSNKFVIMPVISKVRNMGWDGSGLHCRSSNDSKGNQDYQCLYSLHTYQPIDEEKDFNFIGKDNYMKENRKIFRKENYGKISVREFRNKLFYSIFHNVKKS